MKMNKKKYLIIVGIVAAAVAVSILLYGMPANHQPVITGLVAEPDKIVPRGTCQIVCNATDPDGDQLSYNWSVSAGNITGTGASVNWIAPHSPGSYNVTVTVADGQGAKVMRYIIVTVKANTAPTIKSLVASVRWTTPLGNLQVVCNATDLDDDELSYEWLSDGGEISGEGATVNWTAPQAVGAYNITVVVRDGRGGQDTRKVPLSVALDTPPTIEHLTVRPNGHIYLREATHPGCDYDVWTNQKYDIECTASGTDGELSYHWLSSSTAGSISGQGSTITWTAPDEKSVEVTVTVIVSDAIGNETVGDIVFWVPSCSCGSWGLD